MPVQPHDTRAQAIAQIHLPRKRLVPAAREISQQAAVPFDANCIFVMRIVRLAPQLQFVSDPQTRKQTFPFVGLQAGDERHLQ